MSLTFTSNYKLSSPCLLFILALILNQNVDCLNHRNFGNGDGINIDLPSTSESFVVIDDDDGGSLIDNSRNQNEERVAYIGRIFRLTVNNSNSSSVDRGARFYEAKKNDNFILPSWLLFDKSSGSLWGVPTPDDEGHFEVVVRSFLTNNNSNHQQQLNTTIYRFKLTVKEFEVRRDPVRNRCITVGDRLTRLDLVLDVTEGCIKPKQRVIAIENLAKFFGMPPEVFALIGQPEPDDITDSAVIMAGPGNVRKSTPSSSSSSSTVLQVTVGCMGRLWPETTPIVRQLKRQTRDGVIAEVIGLPVIGWRVKLDSAEDLIDGGADDEAKRRSRRDLPDSGSGDFDDTYYEGDYDDEEYDYDTEYDNVDVPITKATTPKTTTTTATRTTSTTTTTTTAATTTTTTRIRADTPTIKPTMTTTSTTATATTVKPPGVNVTELTLTSTTKFNTSKPMTVSSTFTTSTTTVKPTSIRVTETSVHPHRHHHGELIPPPSIGDANSNNQPNLLDTTTTTPSSSTAAETAKLPDTYDDYEDYDDEEDDDIESETIVPIEANSTPATVFTTEPTKSGFTVTESVTSFLTTSAVGKGEPIISNTTPFVEAESTTKKDEDEKVDESTDFEFVPETTSTTSMTTTTVHQSVIEEEVDDARTTTKVDETTEEPIGLPSTSTILSSFDSDDEVTMIGEREATVTRQISAAATTTAIRDVTETVEYTMKNFPPTIQKRLNRLAITAGKLFANRLPLDIFHDIEDGYDLKLEVLDVDGNPLSPSHWLQFDARNREIYGLPLESDVSGWEYAVRATDRENSSVVERLMVHVQHHKGRRAVNHEFVVYVHVMDRHFVRDVDWSTKVLRSIATLYRSNLTEITVRAINYTSDPAVFTWTNDTLPTSYCAKAEIERIYDMLKANDHGDPSRIFSNLLTPEIRVKKVALRGLSTCERKPQLPPLLAPIPASNNYSPILRNPVDHINATVGELLVFRVPDDTFFDPEDFDTPNLKLTLVTNDRQPLPATGWLQFDGKNREFYGIPLPKDVGHEYYQLICEDSGGLLAADSLEVVVQLPASNLKHNVEFGMSILIEYERFASSADLQRKFVEKLKDLFYDKTTNNIQLHSIIKGSTTVTWYNKSLSLDSGCPHNAIKRLESLLVNGDRTIAARVQDIMDPEFPVKSIKLQLIGACKGRSLMPSTVKTTEPSIVIDGNNNNYNGFDGGRNSASFPIDDSIVRQNGDEYLVTFIVPAVIISVILLLAGVVACFLYRKRRTGKGKLGGGDGGGDDAATAVVDARNSYGNKGIPVIFQEELDEKPESGTKTPIILKDEKPPLAPPEYSKSGNLKLTEDTQQQQQCHHHQQPPPPPLHQHPQPYQPPPPFAASQDVGAATRQQQRVKHATPTYRKPPPYVPP